MALAATMSNTNLKSLTFPCDVASSSTKASSFGQVTLKRESETLITTKRTRIESTLLLPQLSPTSTSTSTSPTKQSPAVLKLSRVWRQLQGCNNWKNLVEPLHPLLREEIIRYGEFVTATYKAFDLDPSSKRYLNCKFGKKNMLREVGLESSGYAVTKYIYATPDINIPIQNGHSCGRWIGYVAVSSDDECKRLGRRDVTITFRGTVTNPEWMANMMSSLTPARLDPHNPRPEVKVEAGFLSLYTSDETSTRKFGLGSCREQLLSEVSRLINKYQREEMSITLAGHSMGSSLALLLAYDLAELGLNQRDSKEEIPITVFSFGGPRVGNSCFKERCEELGLKVLRIVNVNDPITKLPGVFLNENFRVLGGTKYEFPWSYSCYAHVGIELALDFFKMDNPSCVHDLETYINLLRCPKGLKFRREAGRDLVNKAKEVILSSKNVDWAKELLLNAQNFDTLPWISAAYNFANFVQSQRIC